MSLETRVTDLIDEINALKQTYEGKADLIDQRIAAAFDYLDVGTIYVDQDAGDDTNSGGANNPVATIGRALDMIPRFGSANIYLRGDEFLLTERLSLGDRRIRLIGAGRIRLRGGNFSLRSNEPAHVVLEIPVIADAQSVRSMFFGNGATALKLIIQADIELCDQALFDNVNHRNYATEVVIAFSNITISSEATTSRPRLLFLQRGALIMWVARTTLPANTTWADMVGVNTSAYLGNVNIEAS